MVASLQITRTSIDADSPISGTLKPGQLSVEMGTPTRLWVGVPAGNDATLQKLIYDSSNTGAALIEPVGAGTWGRLQTATWQRSVALAGDTMTGALTTPGITVTGTGIIYSGIGLGNSMGLSWTGIPELWVDGTLIGNIAMTSQLGAYVAKAGDTMTGALTVKMVWPTITLDGDAISGRDINFASAGSLRWNVSANGGVAESGGNVGSPFGINRFDDNGNYIGPALTIERATGTATFSADISATGIRFPPFSVSTHAFALGWNAGVGTGKNVALYVDNIAQGNLILSDGTVEAGATAIEGMTLLGGAATMHAYYTGLIVSWSVAFSDRRTKTNLEPVIVDALDVVNRLTVYAADVTPPFPGGITQHWDCALIADEVAQHIPAAYIAAPENGYDILRELPLIATLVKAVQQLTARITALEAAAP